MYTSFENFDKNLKSLGVNLTHIKTELYAPIVRCYATAIMSRRPQRICHI